MALGPNGIAVMSPAASWGKGEKRDSLEFFYAAQRVM
jgi:hypothetical protein